MGASSADALRRGLRDLGYEQGKNIVVEYRFTEGQDERIPSLIGELIHLKVEALVLAGLPGVRAAKKTTKTIPIVMLLNADPVELGFVDSLARPGGNITGSSFMVEELSGKRLALLKEAIPSVSRVAVLWFEPNSGSAIAVDAMKAASQKLSVELLLLPVHGPTDLIGTFQAAIRGRVEGLIVVEDAVAEKNMEEILKLAATHSLAVVAHYKAFAEAGALLAYGPSLSGMYRQSAYYVDRILKGANAGDLPVERATKFDLIINLKTAKALGVTIPPALLVRADEVSQFGVVTRVWDTCRKLGLNKVVMQTRK